MSGLLALAFGAGLLAPRQPLRVRTATRRADATFGGIGRTDDPCADFRPCSAEHVPPTGASRPLALSAHVSTWLSTHQLAVVLVVGLIVALTAAATALASRTRAPATPSSRIASASALRR